MALPRPVPLLLMLKKRGEPSLRVALVSRATVSSCWFE